MHNRWAFSHTHGDTIGCETLLVEGENEHVFNSDNNVYSMVFYDLFGVHFDIYKLNNSKCCYNPLHQG